MGRIIQAASLREVLTYNSTQKGVYNTHPAYVLDFFRGEDALSVLRAAISDVNAGRFGEPSEGLLKFYSLNPLSELKDMDSQKEWLQFTVEVMREKLKWNGLGYVPNFTIYGGEKESGRSEFHCDDGEGKETIMVIYTEDGIKNEGMRKRLKPFVAEDRIDSIVRDLP